MARTSPPSPGMRILSPLRSSAELISFLNQPPICTPVFPAMRHLSPNSPESSSHSSCPPIQRIQADISIAVMPNGTAVK